MSAINLLPSDLLPSAPLIRTANFLKSIVTVSFVIFILILVGSVSFFTINSLSLRSSTLKQEETKNSIKSLEETEQGLVLVKDRLAKIKEVYAMESSSDEIDRLSTIYPQVSEGVILSEAVAAKDKLETTYIVSDSSLLTRLMAGIVTEGSFKRIDLYSFGFNPNVGYIISLGYSSK